MCNARQEYIKSLNLDWYILIDDIRVPMDMWPGTRQCNTSITQAEVVKLKLPINNPFIDDCISYAKMVGYCYRMPYDTSYVTAMVGITPEIKPLLLLKHKFYLREYNGEFTNFRELYFDTAN